MPHLQSVPLSALRVEDEEAFAVIPEYAPLKAALLSADAHYRVPPAGSPLARWDHVLLLNLGFWLPGEPDDVLEARAVTADVVLHRAWHHVLHRALGPAGDSVEGLMLGEAVASAFDVYAVGHLLRARPDAGMLQTQVPAMTGVLQEAGLDHGEVTAFFEHCAEAPTAAFEQLRTLLYDVGVALCHAQGAEAAAAVLVGCQDRPMAPLLHHFEFATWTLYARAYARGDGAAARVLHAELAGQPDPVAELMARCVPAP